jgi:hypothetical protein
MFDGKSMIIEDQLIENYVHWSLKGIRRATRASPAVNQPCACVRTASPRV